jgi:hypothetical protein
MMQDKPTAPTLPTRGALRRRLSHIDYKWIALSNTTLGAFLFSNSTAILTDRFPPEERGMTMGMFAAPNTTSIMNAVPAEHRGVSSGMRATFQNTANTLSITLIFPMVMVGLASSLPHALYGGLTQAGIPNAVAQGNLIGKTFFPTLIAGPFEQGLRIAFSISVAVSLLAAFASLLRGQRYIYEHAHPQAGRVAQLNPEPQPASTTGFQSVEEQ